MSKIYKKIKLPRKGKTPIGATYVGGILNDGGGVIIFPGKDGKLHVKVIPPSAPVFPYLQAVSSLAAMSEQTKVDAAVSRQLHDLAETILNDNSAAIGAALGA